MVFSIASVLALGCGALAVLFRGAGSRNLAFWLFCAGCLGLAAENYLLALTSGAGAARVEFLQVLRLAGVPFVGLVWLLFSRTFSRGQPVEHLKEWRFPLAGLGLACIALPVIAAVSGGFITDAHSEGGSSQWAVSLTSFGKGAVLLSLVMSCLILMNLEQTLRAAVGTTRWRIKYMVFGVGLVFGMRIYTSSQALLYSGITWNWQILNAAAVTLGLAMAGLSLWRQRTFTIDLYPSSAVLHKSVTILLVGAYLLAVGVLAEAATVLGGYQSFPLQALLIMLGLTGLAVLSYSDRMQQRMRLLVNRHFRRPAYDSRQIWKTFTEKTASLVREPDLCRAVVQAVSETFNALTVTIWTKTETGQLAFAASTAMSEGTASERSTTHPQDAQWLAALERRLVGAAPSSKRADEGERTQETRRQERKFYPIELDVLQGDEVRTIQGLNPSTFKHGGRRVLVPVAAQGQLLGLMVLGDRVEGIPFSLEELDLLKCIGDQLAALLHGIRLSNQLAEARELEAFQTMSAFFVHDLKNTSSSLSLLLQNLGTHFDNPEFRQDALKAVSRSVDRLNQVIKQLALFRRKFELRTVQTDLNELIRCTLSGLNGTAGSTLKLELEPCPHARIDPEQLQKVITNLVLNAREALGENGEICVRTSQKDGWIVLSVSDTGSGMSPEFVQKSLFRPFQTTKKSGLGIGMFHCKAIVEAHQGKIVVESEVGTGTVFKVLLPS
jgi:signal transduction histidine kinase